MLIRDFQIINTFLFIAVCGCDVYVPKPAQIALRHGTFLIAPIEITGHYANMDVDSIVFSYTTTSKDADAFWQEFDSSATTDKWTCEKETITQRIYERLIAKTGKQIFHSVEQVRVSYESANGRVVVAWVQADTVDAVKNFSQTGESSFAESAVWPRFNELARLTNSTPK